MILRLFFSQRVYDESIPKNAQEYDKQSLLSMNAYLREREECSFPCQTLRCKILNQLFLDQIQYNAKKFIECCSNIQKQS